MKVIVGDTGVLIPRRMLRGVKEVDIRKEGRNIVVEPSAPDSDPIFDLGKNPVNCGVNDGANSPTNTKNATR
jgi:virulence-associated protein VagC